MNFKIVALFLFLFTQMLTAREVQFRREADSATWVLVINDADYVIKECALDGKIKQAKGSVAKVDDVWLLKDTNALDQSFVSGKSFVERKADGVAYLVEKERVDDFLKALKECDLFIRETLLRDYFRHVPEKQRTGGKDERGQT